ncbi:hypothetical protein U1769_10510 [Sphingomonas sp. ZT3P38]|uniref:hypothetical protein n=1 Tax=Parasphingomonas zepuensis TaxID=3096161 RepID=UPI002FC63E76
MLMVAGLMAVAPCAGAQQASITVANVKGWRSDPQKIKIYSRDGSPGLVTDLRGQLRPGLLEWNPDYDLVKLTDAAGEVRWIMAKDLDLEFCAKPITRSISSGGGSAQNQALTVGSGEGCPQ